MYSSIAAKGRQTMRDLRKYARQTSFRLIAGGILIVIIAGVVVTWLIYGKSAAFSALLCIGIGLLPIVFIFLLFLLISAILRKYDG
jgi:fatty acid desaturase